MLILFVFAALAGFSTMLSPCILPVLPIVLAIGASHGKRKLIGMCTGLVGSFTFFTLTLTFLVQSFGVSPDLLRTIALVLIFFFGLSMVVPRFSEWLFRFFTPVAQVGEKFKVKGKKEGFLGGFILGVSLGLIWTPCAGPILAAIIAFVATEEISWHTLLLLVTYTMGAAIPFFFLGWGWGKAIQSKFLVAHVEGIRRFFGLFTIFVALALAFHADSFLLQKIGQWVPSFQVEDNQLVIQELHKLKEKPVMPSKTFYGKAPELRGISSWINSPPLSLGELRGKVVLIDFWTYTCINCLRTLPYVEEWYEKYHDKGLVIIGVHSPEFEFEKKLKNVQGAVKRLGVNYPVALDNDYETWQAYDNHYWPAHYLIDQKGEIVYRHFGEGGYREMEALIQDLLQAKGGLVHNPMSSEGYITPETYLGANRGRSYTKENGIALDKAATYRYERALQDDEVGLKGKWKIEREFITAESDDATIDMNVLAKQVYIVLAGSSQKPLEVYLDGKKVKEFVVDEDRKYDLVDTAYGRHFLSLKVPKGIDAYVFTFGAESKQGKSS